MGKEQTGAYHVKLDAGNEAKPSDLLHMGVAAQLFPQAMSQGHSIVVHLLQEARGQQHVQDSLAGCADQGVAGKCRAMVSRGHHISDLLLEKDGPDGQASCRMAHKSSAVDVTAVGQLDPTLLMRLMTMIVITPAEIQQRKVLQD